MSRDHKPELPDEASRIIKNNGRIEPSRISNELFFGHQGPPRVWLKNKQVPGLAMTRSIGDLVAGSVGVTAEPEIQIFNNLKPHDKALIIASDGLWDRLTNEEI